MRINEARPYRVLTVPGLHNSGPDHWQSLWERAHPEYRRIVQRDWANPEIDEWAATVAREIRSDERPAILVAHSFGCIAVADCAAHLERGRILAAMLVAPANPARFGISVERSHRVLDFPTVLVASSNDPWLALVKARELAAAWNSHFLTLGDCGHINAESGFGAWPEGERLLYEFQKAGLRHPKATSRRSTIRPHTFAG